MLPLIRVLLVDDNPEFLKSASDFLALQPSLQVVGCAISGAEALAQIPRLAPHLVLMDWAMPEIYAAYQSAPKRAACRDSHALQHPPIPRRRSVSRGRWLYQQSGVECAIDAAHSTVVRCTSRAAKWK